MDTDDIRRLYPAGELKAHERLASFIKEKGGRYHKNRDVPCLEGTSVLSPYLSAGVISARQCVGATKLANKGRVSTGDEGLKAWIKEVGWRVRGSNNREYP